MSDKPANVDNILLTNTFGTWVTKTNEIASKLNLTFDNIGNVSELVTSTTESCVLAINELHSNALVVAFANLNTFAGDSSGNSVIPLSGGLYNTGYGANTLVNAQAYASNNTAIGQAALKEVTTSNNNTAVGQAALAALITGSNNVAVGQQAGTNINTGDDNVTVGAQALLNNASGSRNIAIGKESLSTLTVGDNNIAIGAQAQLSLDTGVENISIGTESLGNNIASSYNIGIGYSALGKTALYAFGNNIAIGYKSLEYNSGYLNIGIGYKALGTLTSSLLSVNTSRNIAIGDNTGLSSSSEKIKENIYIGGLSGSESDYSYENIVLGTQSLYSCNNSFRNILIGNYVINSTTNADYNIILTTSGSVPSLGTTANNFSYNVIIGNPNQNSWDANVSINNIIIGNSALNNNIKGGNNIIIGYKAGYSSSWAGTTDGNQLRIGLGDTTATALIEGQFLTDSYLKVNSNLIVTANVTLSGLPTSSAGLTSGKLWYSTANNNVQIVP